MLEVWLAGYKDYTDGEMGTSLPYDEQGGLMFIAKHWVVSLAIAEGHPDSKLEFTAIELGNGTTHVAIGDIEDYKEALSGGEAPGEFTRVRHANWGTSL